MKLPIKTDPNAPLGHLFFVGNMHNQMPKAHGVIRDIVEVKDDPDKYFDEVYDHVSMLLGEHTWRQLPHWYGAFVGAIEVAIKRQMSEIANLQMGEEARWRS